MMTGARSRLASGLGKSVWEHDLSVSGIRPYRRLPCGNRRWRANSRGDHQMAITKSKVFSGRKTVLIA